MLNLYLASFLFCLHTVFSVKFSTEPICLNAQNEMKKVVCEDSSRVIFISLVKYTNDFLNMCSDENLNNSNKTISKNLASLNICSAYPTQELASVCNGKQECLINLAQPDFQYGFMGSNCDFRAKILSVSYECIPNKFDSSNIPKYNICPGGTIDRPLLGFVHTPNYPKSYDSSQFCQLTLKMNEKIKRIEIFLIDLETEGLSKRHYRPTDYLQINNKEIIYGKKSYMLVYNDTEDATIVFRTVLFFNQKGFLLYFETIQVPDPLIDLVEETDSLEVETTTNIPITETTTTNSSIVFGSLNETVNQNNFNQTNSSMVQSEDNRVDSYLSQKYVSVDESPKINKITSYFNDLTLKTIVSLVVLVIVLSSVIVFLVVYNRKRLFNSSIKYVDASLVGNNSHFYDASLINGYLESNNISAINGSFVFAPGSSNLGAFANQSKNRLSDDSLRIVLINKSGNSSIEPIVLATKSTSSTETYDEIPNVKETCFKREEQKEAHLAKVNEYCYIQANGLVSGAPERVENMECGAVSIDLYQSKKTPPNSGFHSPNFETMVTSTPSIPKTLPPNKDLHKNDDQDCEYDYQSLNNPPVKHEYRSCYDETSYETNDEETQTIIKTTIEVEKTLVNDDQFKESDNDEYAIDYQIPTNILLSN